MTHAIDELALSGLSAELSVGRGGCFEAVALDLWSEMRVAQER